MRCPVSRPVVMWRVAACAAAVWLAATSVAAAGAEAPPKPPAEAAARAELPLPPLPPLAPPGPPPADPEPSLYRAPAVLAHGALLLLVAEPQAPALKSGNPPTLKARPHDIVQAPTDPKPLEGTITDERDGMIWFRDTRGIAHPRNPLRIADLVTFQRQANTVQLVVRERSQQAGQNAAAHLALAQDCLDADLLPEAEAELKRALELDPRHLAARLKLADLYLSQDQRDAEAAVLLAATEGGTDAPEVRERLGQRCLEMGLFYQAAEHFTRGFLLAAKAAPDTAVERVPVPADAAARRLLRLAAEARLLGGRTPEAEALLQRLLDAVPDDPAARNAQALADLLAGRAEAALAALRKVVESPAPPASARNNLGALLFNAGEHEAALAQFEACRAAAPHHTTAAANAALACAALGRGDEARKLLDAIAPPPERSLGYWLAAGYVRERLGESQGAIAAYRQARALDPACRYAACGLGRCLLAAGNAQGAAEAFGDARLLAPGDPLPLRGLAACHLAAGQLPAAAAIFRRLATAPGADPLDLVRLGVLRLRGQDGRKEAAALFDQALAAPGTPDAYALAASAYVAYAEGDATLAEERLRRAERATDAPDAAHYAAAALERLAAARGEVATRVPIGAAGAARLPEGWTATGQGSPAPEVRGSELRFEGAAAAANERAVVCTVPLAAPADQGPARPFARLEIGAIAPLTNDAAVGLQLGVGQSVFQVALRTTRQPQVTRGLAYRILPGGQPPTPWADLPGTVAVERLRLGLGLSTRAQDALDVFLNGRAVGQPIPFDALNPAPQEVVLGIFAAAEPQQQCLFIVHEIELVWRKP